MSGSSGTVKITNRATRAVPLTVAVSLSDKDGRMPDVDMLAVEVNAGGFLAHTFEFESAVERGCVRKAFLLDGEMAPIAPPAACTEG